MSPCMAITAGQPMSAKAVATVVAPAAAALAPSQALITASRGTSSGRSRLSVAAISACCQPKGPPSSVRLRVPPLSVVPWPMKWRGCAAAAGRSPCRGRASSETARVAP